MGFFFFFVERYYILNNRVNNTDAATRNGELYVLYQRSVNRQLFF